MGVGQHTELPRERMKGRMGGRGTTTSSEAESVYFLRLQRPPYTGPARYTSIRKGGWNEKEGNLLAAVQVGMIPGKGIEGSRRYPAIAQLFGRVFLEATDVRPYTTPSPASITRVL